MNRSSVLLLLALGLGACASSGGSPGMAQQADDDAEEVALQIRPEDVVEGHFGEFMLELHRAEQHYTAAVALQAKSGVTPAQVEAAAERALIHRENAEAAFNQLISVLEETSLIAENSERIAYLERLHVADGVEIPTVPVYFGFSSAEVSRSEEEKIKNLVALLEEYPIYSLRLLGYADTVGGRERNYRLAEQRTYMVMRTLFKYGLPVNTVMTVTVGEPEGPDETRNPQNRRVEVIPYVHGRNPHYVASQTGHGSAQGGASRRPSSFDPGDESSAELPYPDRP